MCAENAEPLSIKSLMLNIPYPLDESAITLPLLPVLFNWHNVVVTAPDVCCLYMFL